MVLLLYYIFTIYKAELPEFLNLHIYMYVYYVFIRVCLILVGFYLIKTWQLCYKVFLFDTKFTFDTYLIAYVSKSFHTTMYFYTLSYTFYNTN